MLGEESVSLSIGSVFIRSVSSIGSAEIASKGEGERGGGRGVDADCTFAGLTGE